jgi:hypothetical protein
MFNQSHWQDPATLSSPVNAALARRRLRLLQALQLKTFDRNLKLHRQTSQPLMKMMELLL